MRWKFKISHLHVSDNSRNAFPKLSRGIFNKIVPCTFFFFTIKLSFSPKTLKKKSSILNQILHSKTLFLYFNTSTKVKEVEI